MRARRIVTGIAITTVSIGAFGAASAEAKSSITAALNADRHKAYVGLWTDGCNADEKASVIGLVKKNRINRIDDAEFGKSKIVPGYYWAFTDKPAKPC